MENQTPEIKKPKLAELPIAEQLKELEKYMSRRRKCAEKKEREGGIIT